MRMTIGISDRPWQSRQVRARGWRVMPARRQSPPCKHRRIEPVHVQARNLAHRHVSPRSFVIDEALALPMRSNDPYCCLSSTIAMQSMASWIPTPNQPGLRVRRGRRPNSRTWSARCRLHIWIPASSRYTASESCCGVSPRPLYPVTRARQPLTDCG